jgi:hypothetical protein
VYKFKPAMPGSPIFPTNASFAQIKLDLLTLYSIAGVSISRIGEWRLWRFGPHAEIGLFKAMVPHELRTLSMLQEESLAIGPSGLLSRAERKRVAASTDNFHDLMDAYANFALVMEYFLGHDDPRVAALPRYFMLLRRLHNEGIWDAVAYDFNIRSLFWTDLATALLSCASWLNFNTQCATRLPQRQGGANVSWGQSTTFGQNNIGNSGAHGGGYTSGAPQACKNFNRGTPCHSQPCPRPHTCDVCGANHPHKGNHP